MTEFYITRPDGTPLGTIEAEDANEAGSLARTLHGPGAYVFLAQHNDPGAFLGRLTQEIADGTLKRDRGES